MGFGDFLGKLGGKLAGGIPFVGPAVGAGIDYLSGRNKAGAEQDQIDKINEFLAREDATRQELLGHAGGMGALLGPSTQTGTTSGSGTERSRTVTDMRNMPEWAKKDQRMLDRVRGMLEGKLTESSTSGQAARTAREVAAANRAFEGALGSDRALSATRGVSPDTSIDLARASKVADIVGGAEGDAEARRRQQLADAQGFLGMTKGSHQFGTQDTSGSFTNQGTTTGTSNNPGAQFATAMGALTPSSPMPGAHGMTPGLDAASGLAGSLSALFANRQPGSSGVTIPQVDMSRRINPGAPINTRLGR